jgi:hypothetical protein
MRGDRYSVPARLSRTSTAARTKPKRGRRRAVYSSIDRMGRYAYGNQPDIAQWNLIRLAETLLPLLAEDRDAAINEAQQAIGEFGKLFDAAYAAGLSRKLARGPKTYLGFPRRPLLDIIPPIDGDGNEMAHSARAIVRKDLISRRDEKAADFPVEWPGW